MSVNYIDKSTGDLIRVAGQGKAEYGASTVRKGTFTGTDNGTGLINITVTFNTPMPDADYLVDITDVSSLENFWVSVAAKTKNGFALYLRKSTGGSSITVNGTYTAFKLYTDTEYNNLLNNAVLTTDVTDEVTSGDMNPVTSNAVATSNKTISLETLKARHSGFDFKFQYNASGSNWADGTISHFYAIPVYESDTSSEYIVFVKGQSTDGVATHLRFWTSGAGVSVRECALNAYCAADPGSSIKYVTEAANDIYINGNPAQGAAVHGMLFLIFVN